MPRLLNGRSQGPGRARDSYDRTLVGSRLEAHIAAVDEAIRALLSQAEPALQPFYGTMLYHLGMDAERGAGGKRLRPVMCTLVFEAPTGDARRALSAAPARAVLPDFTLCDDDSNDQ